MRDWVNYLIQEQSVEYTKIYNEILSILTIMIVLLTVFNCFILLSTFQFTSSFISENDKINLYIASWGAVLAVLIIIGYLILIKIPASKKYIECVAKSESIIINDILNGTEKDIDCILKRYNAIWKICKKK